VATELLEEGRTLFEPAGAALVEAAKKKIKPA